jgi:hypothetical protein
MRRFELHRYEDASGVSGTGVVAQGVQFDDGSCALHWLSQHASTAVYDSVADIEVIHGHGGLTRVAWIDAENTVPKAFTPGRANVYAPPQGSSGAKVGAWASQQALRYRGRTS